MCLIERLGEDFRAQLLCIKYVYGNGRGLKARRVRDDWKVLKADDAKATASTHARCDVQLYQPTSLRNKNNYDLPSELKVNIYDLTKDRDLLLRALPPEASFEDHMDGQ